MLPQLREIEHRFPREVVVIGVHSGKYHAERDTVRIREAALRLGNTHPIVNDRQFRVWRSYAVNAWPTLAVVDPRGYVLGGHAGEFTAEMLSPFLERLIASYDGTEVLDRTERGYPGEEPAIAPGVLRYPGKVTIQGNRIAIADTGHHRVLVGRLDARGYRMRVERVVGTGSRGFDDGVGGTLNAPQGLAFAGDTLYVADAGNHAIRAASLADGSLRTIAGTGDQLRTREDWDAGALSSPWDLALVGRTLYVAMAGIHQLFAVDAISGERRVHSGSGHENIADGSHLDAALAQPMGIVAGEDRVFFVDAESSAVRWADLGVNGEVGTIIGTGLFDFGDKDGVGDEVRMQHQQGLALHRSGRLLLADSYNDALKWVDPRTRSAERWRHGFHEPSGIALLDGVAYVADTNAHRIAIVADASDGIETLEIADV